MRLTLALLVLYSAIGSAAHSQNYGVAGLQLGMSSQTVHARLGSSFQEQLRPQKAYPGEPYPSVLINFTAANYYADNTKREGYALEYIDDKLIYIDHIVRWPMLLRKEMPEFSGTVSDLQARYGKPSFIDVNVTSNAHLIWLWSQGGNLVTPPNQCRDIGSHGFGINGAEGLAYPTKAPANCGTYVQALAYPVDRTLMGLLEVVLLDQQKFYAGVMQSTRRLQGDQLRETDAAKKNKAPI